MGRRIARVKTILSSPRENLIQTRTISASNFLPYGQLIKQAVINPQGIAKDRRELWVARDNVGLR